MAGRTTRSKSRRWAMTDRRAVHAQSAYVLHAQPYRETSLLLDTFSRAFGRVAMIARGARRPRSALRGVLLEFQPLALDWFGKGEVRTLARAEWLGGYPMLRGEALICGYYLNELLVRMLPREDAHEGLFDAYQRTLRSLGSGEPLAPTLRGFEKALLAELGYALSLGVDCVTGTALDPAADYRYDPDRGPVDARIDATDTRPPDPVLRGRTLLDIARDDYSDPRTLAEAKLLMRALISRRLEYRPLSSRRVFKDLLEL